MKIEPTTLLEILGIIFVLVGAFAIHWGFSMVLVGVMVLAAAWRISGDESEEPDL